MTANQIAYQANLERERSNRANESIQQQNAESQYRSSQAALISANASAAKARVEELKAQLAAARNPYEIQQLQAEIKRTEQAAKLDVVNTVIGGVGALTNVGKVATGAYSAIRSAGTAAGQLELAKSRFQQAQSN